MKKSIVNISCGLGNQIFQYAFGYAVSRSSDSKFIIYKYEAQPDHRPYQIEKYDIAYDGIIEHDNRSFVDKLLLKCSRKIEDEEFTFNDNLLNQKNSSVFYLGYWQNWRYFDSYRDDLGCMFQYKEEYSDVCAEYMNDIDNNMDAVSIHIRKGDYDSINLAMDLQYYKDAISYLNSSLKSVRYYIFSDDKDFVRANMDWLDEYVLVENVSDIEEFEIMRKCKHHIIANSTFSWWAAYLGIDRNGIVVAPVVHHWTEDFYLPEWKTIEATINR